MSKTLTVTQKVPILLDCDVLVVGAGMSGFAAAVSASRAGTNVVLAEKNHFPGGVATSGLMCSISNYFVTRDGTQVTTGLPIEFIDRLVSENGAMDEYLRPTQPQIPNDPEVVKRVMIEMLRESNVRTLYGSLLCDVITHRHASSRVVTEGDTIKACVFQARDQSFAVTAKIDELDRFYENSPFFENAEARELLLTELRETRGRWAKMTWEELVSEHE